MAVPGSETGVERKDMKKWSNRNDNTDNYCHFKAEEFLNHPYRISGLIFSFIIHDQVHRDHDEFFFATLLEIQRWTPEILYSSPFGK